MLIAIYKLLKGDHDSAEKAGRERARRAFLQMNDRLLADAGISRELLNRGVKAWPWRAEANAELDSASASSSAPAHAAARVSATAAAASDTANGQRTYGVSDLQRDIEDQRRAA